MNDELFKDEVENVCKVLKNGGIILYPTDTVWGIGCDATNEEAVAKIFALKKRTEEKSMIVLLDKADNVVKYVQEVPEVAWQLWEVSDKPLTIILPKARSIAKNMIPVEKTIAIRLTFNKFCINVIRRMNRPLVSTSANITGENTPAKFSQISDQIKNGVDYIVSQELEQNATGKPSSIIALGMGGEIKIIRS